MASVPNESTDIDVKVFPNEALLHVLDIDGLQPDESSRLVLLDPNPGADGSLGLDRAFEIHRAPSDLLSGPSRLRLLSDCALLSVLGVRRSMFVPSDRKLLFCAGGANASAGAPNRGKGSWEIEA